MDCKSQVSMEALVALLGFIVFIGVLVHSQRDAFEKMPEVELNKSDSSAVFGKSRDPDANFTRWFR